MERLFRSMAALLFVASAVGIAPLDESRMVQLRTAADHVSVVDAPALYPLLEDAASWRTGDEAGAAIPDYEAILADPEAHRGQLFLIEGRLKRRMAMERISRPGPWEGKLEQWVVQIGVLGETALVYLVDPPANARIDMRVRMPARFYMVMRDRLAQSDADETADFPVFVGNTAELTASGGGSGGAGIFVALLIVLGLFYYGMRSRLKAGAVSPRQLRRRAMREGLTRDHETTEDDADDTPPLPDNPADALDALNRQNEKND